MTIRIYHNPKCSKSRKTLDILQKHGVRPEIVQYLEQPLSAGTLLDVASLLELPVRELIRVHEADFVANRNKLDLADDQQLARWLENHPQALQRPIIVDEAAGRAVIGRPPENVMSLLSR